MKKAVLNFYFQLTTMEDLVNNMNSVLEQNDLPGSPNYVEKSEKKEE